MMNAYPNDEDEELEQLKQEKLRRMVSTSKGADEGSATIMMLNSENFQQVIQGGKPVLVDYYADWCGPCRFMEAVFEKLARKYGGRIIFARINVDENQQIASNYDVFSIPTFIVFSKGKPVNRIIGATSEASMEQFLTSSLQGH